MTYKTLGADVRLRAMAAALRRVSIALGFIGLIALCGTGCRRRPTEARFRLDNGLRVDLIATSRGEKAAVALLFDVGADHDPPGKSGMARLVEHLLSTAGRGGKPARTVEQLESQYGHDWRAATGGDYTLHAVVVPAGRILDEIDDAALRMSRLEPGETDLARERARLLNEIAAMQERDAVPAAMHRAAEAVRPTRGGGARGGVAKEVEALTLDEVERFRRAHYGAATARLIVAGNVDVDAVTQRIKAGFAKVPAGKPPEARPPAPSRVTGTLVLGDAPNAVALAVPAPEPRDPLYPAFLALAARVAAPRGAPRSWKADFAPLARPDVLFVSSPIAPGQPGEETAKRLRAEVTELVKAPLDDDDRARLQDRFAEMLGMAPLRADAVAAEPDEAAFAAGRRAQLGIDGGALAQAARALTPEQVVNAAKLFDTANSAAVVTGGKSN
jgi:zinc protease